jgi:MFS family permease
MERQPTGVIYAWRSIPADTRLLFSTRVLRLFAYGFLSVILAFYLSALGLQEVSIGLMLTLTLLGDTVVSLWITTHADRIGRRMMLIAGAGLMVLAAGLFASTQNFYLLLAAAVIGVISPSGKEVGPFLSIEQASLSQLVPDRGRTKLFGWYNLAGSFATALGALSGGGLSQLLQNAGYPALQSYRMIVLGYGAIGLLMMVLFLRLSPEIEISPELQQNQPTAARSLFGLHHSQKIVLRLAALFSLDAFAGGLVIQSLLALWFNLKFGVDPGVLGAIFFAANLLAGISALSAAWVASKIGLINTMVFTHLPSNVLLILVPFMPSLTLAITLLLLRFTISQMDVPTRQSYVMAVVTPDERSAAAGVTGVARTVGAALSPVLTGIFLSYPALLGLPFMISGGLKIIYDLALYRNFRAVKPPEELRLVTEETPKR